MPSTRKTDYLTPLQNIVSLSEAVAQFGKTSDDPFTWPVIPKCVLHLLSARNPCTFPHSSKHQTHPTEVINTIVTRNYKHRVPPRKRTGEKIQAHMHLHTATFRGKNPERNYAANLTKREQERKCFIDKT